MFSKMIRSLVAVVSTPTVAGMRDRDLTDIGLPRGYALSTDGRAPFDVPNDRT